MANIGQVLTAESREAQRGLTAESMTPEQIQTLIDKDNRRKAQCVAACIRWAAKNKEKGTFSEKRSEYNKRHREKRLGKKNDIEPNISEPQKKQ